MKTLRTYLAAPALVLLVTLLFGGCYTQFALADRDPADAPEAQPVYADQSPVVSIEYLPPVPVMGPAPFFPSLPVLTAPVAGTGGSAAPAKRVSGNQRTPAPPSRPAASRR